VRSIPPRKRAPRLIVLCDRVGTTDAGSGLFERNGRPVSEWSDQGTSAGEFLVNAMARLKSGGEWAPHATVGLS
jgi:hypothetical protein